MPNGLDLIWPNNAKEKQTWTGLHGWGLPYLLAQGLRQKRFLVILCDSVARSQQLLRETQQFLNQDSSDDTNDETHVSPNGVLHFPDWETLPYDQFSPHEDITSARIATLSKLPSLKEGLLFLPVSSLMQFVPPASHIGPGLFELSKGQVLAKDFRLKLTQAGYLMVTEVTRPGDVAIRGSIVDIFPMGVEKPLRLDLFDDEIDSIRTFDVESQRTLETIESINLLPAREFPLTPTGIETFRSNWRTHFDVKTHDCPVYMDVSEGLIPAGIEYYLPLFFNKTESLFDYLPRDAIIVQIGDLATSAQTYWSEVNARYEQYRHDRRRPLLAPSSLWLAPQDFFSKTKQFAQLVVPSSTEEGSAPGHQHFNFKALPPLALTPRSATPLHAFLDFMAGTTSPVLICAESTGRREAILGLMHQAGLSPLVTTLNDFIATRPALGITVASFEYGAHWEDGDLIFVSESALYGQQVLQRRRRTTVTPMQDMEIRHIAELEVGMPIVHIDHGVGRFLGLQHLNLGPEINEFVTIEYAGGDKLYVPVANLDKISRYSASHNEHAPLHRLGTDAWEKTRRKAVERLADVATELLSIYAQRAAKEGFSYPPLTQEYEQFANGFKFEPTPDQQQAIEAVLEDMQSPRPMDRVICGDVGFGKTEVALRAVFLAAINGKQTAVLVPTTLLAQQHYETFCDRLSEWPFRVEVLSRFKTAKEVASIMQAVADGKVDIIIGTHKLLDPKLKFPHLGLVIIDEEHRFGVTHKEKLKKIKTNVDCLTLTATPIPRTLNLSMASIRDISIIATPPLRRLSVKTFIHRYDAAVIQEAILRELMRGGQVYYLHNNVDTINNTAERIKEMVPQARVVVAHGQLRENQLEHVMSDFYHQRFNVLVCTTIIETGIDIPSANTIIIERADTFGLAQLHQLRGRVGRSHHQAYAYCLTPVHTTMTADGKKRLEAIEALGDLGVGFSIATHDMEIRGAGELLGEEQSGHIEGIGYTLYMELLNKTIKAIRQGKDLEYTSMTTEINLHTSALIPDSYIGCPHTRLVFYKRIAAADEPGIYSLKIEMIDRFGLLPDPLKRLFQVSTLKHKAAPFGIVRIDVHEKGGHLEFNKRPNISPQAIVDLLKKSPHDYKIKGNDELRFSDQLDTFEARYEKVEGLLAHFAKFN